MSLGSSTDQFVKQLMLDEPTLRIVTDPDLLRSHSVDWTGLWHGHTPAVLQPESAAQITTIMKLANTFTQPIMTQGGRSSLVAGSTPDGHIAVDLTRLNRIGSLDPTAGQITVDAGVTLEQLQSHLRAHDLIVGVDLGARASATLGGMAATNAGGTHVLRYGSMRQQILGVEAVTGSGQSITANMAGLVKDNTGFDLAGLLCGSEGTLGIITALRLRVHPRPSHQRVALVALGGLQQAAEAAARLRTQRDINAIELISGFGLSTLARHWQRAVPIDPVPPWALLIEWATSGADWPMSDAAFADPMTLLDKQLLEAIDALGADPSGVVVASDERQARELWQWRESQPEAAASLGPVHKADITLPLSRLVEGISRIEAQSTAPMLLFGHLGDGNIHINMIGDQASRPHPNGDPLAPVYQTVLELGGSISAEHGMGRAKAHWLRAQRGDATVAAMQALKQAWDPNGILNPGVLFSNETS